MFESICINNKGDKNVQSHNGRGKRYRGVKEILR